MTRWFILSGTNQKLVISASSLPDRERLLKLKGSGTYSSEDIIRRELLHHLYSEERAPPAPSPSQSQGSERRSGRRPSSKSSHGSRSSSHITANRPTAIKNRLGVPVDNYSTRQTASFTAQKENANPRYRSVGESAHVEVVSDSTQLDRAPLPERTNNQQGSSGNRVPEAPRSRSATPMEVVAPSEHEDDESVLRPVSPDHQRPPPLQRANPGRPMDWNNSIVHDPLTRLPIGLNNSVPQYLQDNSSLIQAHIDLTHRTRQLSDDDKDFMAVWDLFILAKPGRGATTESMPKTIKQFVCANWVWLHQRPSRIPCYLKQITALKAVDRITPDAARDALMLLRPPPVPMDACDRVECDCEWTVETLEQNRKNWTALWNSLHWQTERMKDGEYPPALLQTLEQFINVAGHLLVDRDRKYTRRNILTMLDFGVHTPENLFYVDDKPKKYVDMDAFAAIKLLHSFGKKEAKGEWRKYLDIRKKFDADIVNRDSEDPEDLMRAVLKECLLQFMGPERWQSRRFHEVELHLLYPAGGLRADRLIKQLANLLSMGKTVDPDAPPDSHPEIAEPPALKPASLPNVPPEGKRLPIQKSVEVRGMMECECGFDVVPWNVVYCANRQSRKRKCPHPTYHRLCTDAPFAATKDGRVQDEDWFCEECRKKGWDRAESPGADDGEDKPDDGGDAGGAALSDAPRDKSARDNTRRGAEDAQQREKSPNPQPRKKPRTTREEEAETAPHPILAHDANPAPSTSDAPTHRRLNPNKLREAFAKEELQLYRPSEATAFGRQNQRSQQYEYTVASPIGTARSTPTAESTDTSAPRLVPRAPAIVTEDSASVMSPGSGPDTASPDLPRSKRSNKKDGGPCRKCSATKSRRWHHKLNLEDRPEDGKVWCYNCYSSDSQKKFTAKRKSEAEGPAFRPYAPTLLAAKPKPEMELAKERNRVKAEMDAANLKFLDLQDDEAPQREIDKQNVVAKELRKKYKQLQAEIDATTAGR